MEAEAFGGGALAGGGAFAGAFAREGDFAGDGAFAGEGDFAGCDVAGGGASAALIDKICSSRPVMPSPIGLLASDWTEESSSRHSGG